MYYKLAGLRGKRGARRLFTMTALLAGLITTMVVGLAFADGIMLQIKDVPLKDVVNLLTQQSGVNIVIVDSSKLEKKVTVSLSDVPLEKALDYVVKNAGVAYRRMEDGTYIIGGVAGEEMPMLSPNDVATVLPMITPEPAAVEPIITTVKLIHSKPSELLRLMGWNGTNPALNCEARYPARLLNGQSQTPEITNPGGGNFAMNANTGMVTPVDSLTKIKNNQPVPPAYDPSGYNTGAGRTAEPNTGAAQVPSRPGYTPGPPGMPGGGAPTTPTRPTTPTSSTSTNSNFLWPDGIDQAQPFDLDNSIIVKGTEDAIDKFKKIVRMLDVPPKQVSIKAEFVEVTTNDIKKFGIDWSLQRLNETFDTQFGVAGNVEFGFAVGNLSAQLRTQLTRDVGRIINSPIISTINNQNAYISINNQIPYWITTNIITDNVVVPQTTPQFISVDTNLNVLPRVNGDGTITMMLSPQIADTGTEHASPDGTTSIPEERQQTLFTQRRVANGETIVVGGFIRKNDSHSITKIPVLGDLPIIGGLFRSTVRTTEDRELLIFITPTIIPEVSGGTVGNSPVL